MNTPNIVAAIVLGSSRIIGIVGSKEIDGTIRVKSHAAQSSADFIGKGRVLNVEKMTTCLTSIKARLEEQSSYKIKCFYVAIDCQGLRSVANEVSIHLPSSEIVTDELLASIVVRNKEGNPADRTILEAIPLEYRLGATGAQVSLEPKGMQTDHLQAKFLNIVCKTNTINTIATCFRKAGIEIAGGRFLIAAEQLASIVTNEQERTTGCAIIDFGSETTTVAVYKGKLLRHLIVIPLGSNNITRDIENVFNVEKDEAEHLKRTHGYPALDDIDDKEEIHLRDGGRVKKLTELANIIDARVEEIVQNVKHQIDISNYTHETLVNGIYICGGGAQMKNILSAFKNHFKDEWNVRIVKNANRLTVAYSEPNFNETGNMNTALAIIDNAESDCYGGEYKGLFDEVETEPSAEELAAKAAEEEAARKAAEEKAAEEAAAEEARKAAEEEERRKKKGPSKFGKFLKSVGEWGRGLVSEDD